MPLFGLCSLHIPLSQPLTSILYKETHNVQTSGDNRHSSCNFHHVSQRANARQRSHAPPATLRPDKKKSCAPCQAAAQGSTPADRIDSLATLGRRTQLLPFKPLQRSAFEGANVNMVSTATGHLAFAVTDLEINSGAMPIMFLRAYTSDRREDTGLGTGWSFVFDDRITINNNSATLTTGTGSGIAFRRDGQSPHFVLQVDEPAPHQSFDITEKDTIIERASGFTRTYKKLGATFRLSQISDPNNNAITISFDDRANITQITNGSAVLALEWSNGKTVRLLAVTDNTNRRVSFKQDGQRLREVTDSAGAQWAYNYDGNQLARAADPLNRTILQVWYDHAGRVTEAGDAAGTFLYDYDSASNAVSRRTIVTDQLDAETIYEHTERGAVASITTDEGQTVRFEYNAANRPTRIANSLGDETKFSFDAQNQLLRQTSSDGTDKSFAYDEKNQIASTVENGERTDYTRDERGNIIAAKSSDPAKSYRVELDARGQTTTISSERGRKVSSEHDAAGNETAFTYSDAGRFDTERDAAGNITARRLPSGASYHYEYDAHGKTVKQSDNRGHTVSFGRDASGAATKVTFANGATLQATRDEAGRIVALNTSAGKSRHFAYDARGALTDYTDARGKHKHAEYDHRGRVRSISDSDGNQTTISRDERGRVQHIAVFNRNGSRNDYDKSGQLMASTQATNSVRMEHALYTVGATTAWAAPAMQFAGDCFFGGDSFFDPFFPHESLAEIGFGCDPFGGIFDGLGSILDPFLGFSESRELCIARHHGICTKNLLACLTAAGIGGLTFGAGCTLTTLILGAPICEIIADIIFLAGGAGCLLNASGCVDGEADGCPQ